MTSSLPSPTPRSPDALRGDPTEDDAALLQRILDVSSDALDALEAGDELALRAALEERERLQTAAAPVIALAARPLRRVAEGDDRARLREMALELSFWNRVLARRLLRQSEETARRSERAVTETRLPVPLSLVGICRPVG